MMRWNLDALYTGFDDPTYKKDHKELAQSINEWTDWSAALKSDSPAEPTLMQYLAYEDKVANLASQLLNFCYLTLSVDVNHSLAQKQVDQLQTLLTELTLPSVQIKRWMKAKWPVTLPEFSAEKLAGLSYHLQEVYEASQYMLEDAQEVLLSKLSLTGSNAWTQLHGNLTANLMVDFEDPEKDSVPLSVARNLAYDPDPSVRKVGYEAELKSYKKIENSAAAALNSIKGEVLSVSSMRGFQSPLDETLFISRMDQKTLATMIEVMESYLPVFRSYLKRKGEILGHSEGLPFYDLFAPMGESSKSFTFEEAQSYITKNFSSFSDNLSAFADRAFQENWIDAQPRAGKSGGAFCASIHPIGESRIMSNFTGTFSDVITLAHELGHGFHSHVLMNESILNADYPMPLAETASIFSETIVMQSALKEASEKEKLMLLESSLQDATQVIVDILSRFYFEDTVFAKRPSGPLSVSELNEIMLDAQNRTYGEALSEEKHPAMWINKSHYYEAGMNYYNFPYAFGLLFAKGLYRKSIDMGPAFVDQYIQLLRLTGQASVYDVPASIGIDLHDPEFWIGSLEILKADVDEFLALTAK
jgi:pepF/M3 family oligoendopeptidase